MIDIGSETLLTFSQAAAEQPCRRQGKRVSTVTLWRWATSGSGGIVLETLQTPSGRVTSREALQRFFEALTESRQAGSSSARPAPLAGRRSPSPPTRERESRAVPDREGSVMATLPVHDRWSPESLDSSSSLLRMSCGASLGSAMSSEYQNDDLSVDSIGPAPATLAPPGWEIVLGSRGRETGSGTLPASNGP